jgi:hypothetical protein
MEKVVVMRKWNDPEIRITVSNEAIGIEMSLHDFVRALTDEAAEELVAQAVRDAGNPTLLFTSAQMEKRLVDSIESDKAQAIFVAAAERIVKAMKAETAKVM